MKQDFIAFAFVCFSIYSLLAAHQLFIDIFDSGIIEEFLIEEGKSIKRISKEIGEYEP